MIYDSSAHGVPVFPLHLRIPQDLTGKKCADSNWQLATYMSKGKAAVIVGAQWGDEGKGKIVDVLSQRFDIVARYAGGHNAGHTVLIRGKKFILQLVPCCVLRPGCQGVIGNGVVLDPIAFLREVAALRGAGVKVDGNLFVSSRAHVILPDRKSVV